MIRTIKFKLYPTAEQAKTMCEWLRTCCWIYNRCLEHRIKAYERRKKSVTFFDQQIMLTAWRSRMERLSSAPVEFERDAIRRLDRGFKAFFRRIKSGEKPGFPRFRSHRRYNSLECLEPRCKYANGRTIRIPKLGLLRARGPKLPDETQRLLCVIRQSSGWFAQIVIDDGKPAPAKRPVQSSVGVDVGLNSFATLSDGRKIDNPRWLRKSSRKLRAVQRRVSRRVKGSRNRRNAIQFLCRVHERIASQRRNFCHQHSTALVKKYDLIAVENLNVKGMARTRFAKSILDAGWSTFTNQLERKAEDAGATVVKVDAHRTSQECPNCGALCRKTLSERTHACSCGLRIDRDHAAARVILLRALDGNRGITPVEETTTTSLRVATVQVDPKKQVDKFGDVHHQSHCHATSAGNVAREEVTR